MKVYEMQFSKNIYCHAAPILAHFLLSRETALEAIHETVRRSRQSRLRSCYLALLKQAVNHRGFLLVQLVNKKYKEKFPTPMSGVTALLIFVV
ncbi:hypothetical protein [Ewingella americana]|uniref:hypothetical protein n=1 Tax=Ewingella americana TaxID=41202 RepID=UPI0012AE5441|nr:hypothetical protein [Ewingella americana]MRT03443.1 hypothetical protein [Ewingella americana]